MARTPTVRTAMGRGSAVENKTRGFVMYVSGFLFFGSSASRPSVEMRQDGFPDDRHVHVPLEVVHVREREDLEPIVLVQRPKANVVVLVDLPQLQRHHFLVLVVELEMAAKGNRTFTRENRLPTTMSPHLDCHGVITPSSGPPIKIILSNLRRFSRNRVEFTVLISLLMYGRNELKL